jgi:hypothetical protein
MLHQLQVHRQVVYDLATLHLEPMSGTFERLFFLSGLRDTASGMYVHERLGALYGEQHVHEALAKAHEEMFEGILEVPLAQQEQDLRIYLRTRTTKNTTPGPDEFNYFEDGIQNCIPPQAPAYLRDLFLSNVSALRQLLQNSPPTAPSNK